MLTCILAQRGARRLRARRPERFRPRARALASFTGENSEAESARERADRLSGAARARGLRNEIFDYAGRLMRARGDPALVMPPHWDVYGFAPSRTQALATAQEFANEIKAASPRTRVFISEYFRVIWIP